MEKSKKVEKDGVQAYFEVHKTHPCIFETSDGYLFENQINALSHRQTLEDKQVITHKNPMIIEVKDDSDNTPDE